MRQGLGPNSVCYMSPKHKPAPWLVCTVHAPGKVAPHMTMLSSPSQGKNKTDQKIASTVHNEVDVSDPLVFNDTLVAD